MRDIRFYPSRCAICGTEKGVTELYPANVDLQTFTPDIFSARRRPDGIHYRIVRCNNCGLVRSDPVADLKVLTQLYAKSCFNYADEVANLKFTYKHHLTKLTGYGVKKSTLLEIGCGNGFFLEEALAQGYTVVKGVEPSIAAVSKADPRLRQHIVCDIMRPGLFETGYFDVICMFQVLDHIADPGVLLDECFRVLKPGGLILCLNHNIEALAAKLLKSRSPIVDVEHPYLYSPATMTRIFSKHGFQIRDIGPVWNKYTLYYLVRLIPLPNLLKRIMLIMLKKSFAGNIRLSVPLGNLYMIARKPDKKGSGVDVFNRDVTDNEGYLYTTNARLSSFLANRRLTDAALASIDFTGKRVLDVGCGDGTYTLELFDRGKPSGMCGVDPADEAIKIAQKKAGTPGINFETQSADALAYEAKSFDIVHLRGVLHHMKNPLDALRESLRVSRSLVVIEPNGYNPVLKLLERFSKYHLEHGEKSYMPATLERWVGQAGGKVITRRYVGLVPFFCPDWLAKFLKFVEPVVERIPFINILGCAVYILVVERADDQK